MNAPDPLTVALADLQKRADAADTRVENLEGKLAQAREERAHARAAIEHIRSLLGDSSGLGEPAGGNDRDQRTEQQKVALFTAIVGGISGMEAVGKALKQAPHPLSLSELTAAVHQLGWIPDAENQERAVRAAANRLRNKDGDFTYVSKRWHFVPRHMNQLPAPLQSAAGLNGENP